MGNVDSVKQVEYRVAYHVFFVKEPDYLMNIITTYEKLESTDKRTQRKSKRSDVMDKKEFMYTEVVSNRFFY